MFYSSRMLRDSDLKLRLPNRHTMMFLPDPSSCLHLAYQIRVCLVVSLLYRCVQFESIATVDVNLALNKSAYQHSTFEEFQGPHVASRAVDGNRDADMFKRSCSHTKKGNPPWWMVDLREELLVKAVEITNRDEFHNRLHNFTIETGTVRSPDGTLLEPKLCHLALGTQGSATTVRYPCSQPVMARFVKVSLTADGFLQLCEVAVLGTETRHFQSVPSCMARCSVTQSCTSLNIRALGYGTAVLCELMSDLRGQQVSTQLNVLGWVHCLFS